MDVGRLIEKAQAQGRKALTEAEAKSVLKCYGVPVVEEAVAASPAEAALSAATFGFPVVLKGLGENLTHKTERGLVHLKLRNKREVLTAAKAIARGAGKDLEGYLVQPYVAGRREFVAGLLCDPHFGPMIMLGLGGVFTEALKDVAFRMAPVDEAEAGRMMDELRSSRLFAPFRGEAGVCRDQIVASLVGLSHLAEECPHVVEVDINPLVVGADGRVTAVDALIVLGERPKETTARPPVDVKDIARIFSPRSLAFVGASAQLGKWGNLLLTNCLAGGFEGEVYLVNPKGGEIAGRPVYKALNDIPGSVDLVVVTIPASQILALLPACRDKGVRYMLLVTSGFCETGEEGAVLERQLIQAAREAGVLLVGPNTMGICNPHERFHCVATPYWPMAGSIGLVSQSGNLGTQLLAFAEQEGIGIRSFCGSGNESMITVEDYLNGLGQDDVTKTVLLYIESVKDGRRFYRAVRETSRRKPVIVLKGGRTEAGSRAASSHTGAMASDIGVFDAACRQAGAVPAEHPMDLVDLAAAFSSLPLPRGKRIALMTLGGGWGVVATDMCIQTGLTVPRLTPDIIARLDTVLPPYWSKENPVDLVGELAATTPIQVLEALAAWEGCDAVIHLGVVGRLHLVCSMLQAVRASGQAIDPAYAEQGLAMYRQAEQDFFACAAKFMERYRKPILGVFLDDRKSRTLTDIPGSPYKGVAFLTPERAVRALASMATYYGWRKDHEAEK